MKNKILIDIQKALSMFQIKVLTHCIVLMFILDNFVELLRIRQNKEFL